jgi:hypothetical protein
MCSSRDLVVGVAKNGDGLENLAMAFLRKDIKEELMLPSFEEWRKEHKQVELF